MTGLAAAEANEDDVQRELVKLRKDVARLKSERDDAIEDAEDLRQQLRYAEESSIESSDAHDKVEQLSTAVRKLNAYLGWSATAACSGEDTCWCDAHADKRMGMPPLSVELAMLKAESRRNAAASTEVPPST